MSSRLSSINGALRRYDSRLFARQQSNGRIDVFIRSRFGGHLPEMVLSLTEDWTLKGEPCPWGIEPLLRRISEIDGWKSRDIVKELEQADEKKKVQEAKKFRNQTEDALYEAAPQIRRAWNGINTGTLEKVYRKEGSHGYCKPRLGL